MQIHDTLWTKSVLSGVAVLMFIASGVATPTYANDLEKTSSALLEDGFEQGLVDPEFDNRGFRLLGVDTTNKALLVCNIDPFTGDLMLGSCEVVADRVSTISYDNYNGPEWAYGDLETFIAYVAEDEQGKYFLRAVRETPTGQWEVTDLEQGADRYPIMASRAGTVGPPRIAYMYKGAEVASFETRWRELYDPSNEKLLYDGFPKGIRWNEEGDKIVLNAKKDPDNRLASFQIRLVNVETGTAEFVTSGPRDKLSAFINRAPDFGGNEIIVYNIDQRSIGVSLKKGKQWRRINELKVPDNRGKPWLDSPELFVADGRTFVVFSQNSVPWPRFLVDSTAAGDIWIASIDPKNPWYQRVTPDTEADRFEPEPFTLATGEVIIYYSQYIGNQIQVEKSATGLFAD